MVSCTILNDGRKKKRHTNHAGSRSIGILPFQEICRRYISGHADGVLNVDLTLQSITIILQVLCTVQEGQDEGISGMIGPEFVQEGLRSVSTPLCPPWIHTYSKILEVSIFLDGITPLTLQDLKDRENNVSPQVRESCNPELGMPYNS
jgi:hypothetical protein